MLFFEGIYVERNFHRVKLSRFVSITALLSVFFCQIVGGSAIANSLQRVSQNPSEKIN
ncbi:MAG: hypothetical protein ABI180_03320 [Microcoleus sp.]